MSRSIGKFLGAPAVNNQDDGYQQSLVQALQQYLAQNHIINDLAHVRSEFTNFDQFPNPLKEVLLDIQYNTGGLNKQNWPNLYNAINNRDVNGIINNVHRTNVGQNRNDWAERLARSIRF